MIRSFPGGQGGCGVEEGAAPSQRHSRCEAEEEMTWHALKWILVGEREVSGNLVVAQVPEKPDSGVDRLLKAGEPWKGSREGQGLSHLSFLLTDAGGKGLALVSGTR